MQKVLSLLTLILIVSSFAVAQQSSSASHSVTVSIPTVLMIRLTNGQSNAGLNSASVAFNFDSDTHRNTFINAINNGQEAELAPTSYTFNDVIVFSSLSGWKVEVSTLDATTGFDWSKIAVRSAPFNTTSGPIIERVDEWNLGTTTEIASGIRTQGWRSLGFGGGDYLMRADGSEDAGSFSATVMYTIMNP
jgi:hypothetical protein